MEKNSQEVLVKYLTQYHSQLLGYLRSLLGQREDAEDVLQKTNLVIWQKFDQFDPESDFFSWASTIAFYEARNFIRIRSRDRHYFNEELLGTLSKERSQDLKASQTKQAALELCLKKLNRENESLIRTLYQNSKTIKELATELGKAPQSLYNRIVTIKQKLLTCVRKQLDGEIGI